VACSVGHTAASATKPEVLVSGKHLFYWPDVSDRTIVWMDDRNGPSSNPLSNPDIYGYDRLTRREFPICTVKGKQLFPRVSGSTVVWSDFRNVPKSKVRTRAADPDIYGYDLTTRREFPICRAKGSQGPADISGDIIVWADGRQRGTSGEDIYGYDLRTRRTFAVCAAPGDQTHPAVSGQRVVWTDYRGASPQKLSAGTSVGAIYLRDLSTGRTVRISPPGQDGTFAQIDGQTVIWQQMTEHAKSGFYVYDLGTKRIRFVSTGTVMLRYAFSQGMVLWVEEDRDLLGALDFVVRGIRLSDGFRFVVARGADAASPGFATLSGDTAVWQSWGRNGASDVAQLVLARLRLAD
jgi:beta propeller repeat protein